MPVLSMALRTAPSNGFASSVGPVDPREGGSPSEGQSFIRVRDGRQHVVEDVVLLDVGWEQP